MGQVTLPNRPSGGDVRAIADILADFDAITAEINGNLEAENMATGMKPGTLLGSWKTVANAWSRYSAQEGSGGGLTYYMGAGTKASSAAADFDQMIVPMFQNDFTVSGVNRKFRLRMAVLTNGVAPGANFHGELRRVNTSGGGNNLLVPTFLAEDAEAVIGAPAANTVTQAVSAVIDVPASAPLALAVTIVNVVAANARGYIALQLQQRHEA